MPYEKVVIGTDGSPTAGVAERVAVELARAAEAELVIVSAYTDEDGKTRSEEAVEAARQRSEASGVRIETRRSKVSRRTPSPRPRTVETPI